MQMRLEAREQVGASWGSNQQLGTRSGLWNAHTPAHPPTHQPTHLHQVVVGKVERGQVAQRRQVGQLLHARHNAVLHRLGEQAGRGGAPHQVQRLAGGGWAGWVGKVRQAGVGQQQMRARQAARTAHAQCRGNIMQSPPPHVQPEPHLQAERGELGPGGDGAQVEAGAGGHIQRLQARQRVRQPVGQRLEQRVAAQLL